MTAELAAAASTFGVGHIAVTAAITAALALAAAAWRLPRTMLVDQLAVAVLGFVAALLWRWSANMPQLNDDGLPGFSANDWLAPVLTYVTPCPPTSTCERRRSCAASPRPARWRPSPPSSSTSSRSEPRGNEL